MAMGSEKSDPNGYFHEYQDLDDQTISECPAEEFVQEEIQRPTSCMKVFVRTLFLVSLVALVHGTIAICTVHQYIVPLSLFCSAAVLSCIEALVLVNVIDSSKSAPFGVIATSGNSSKKTLSKCLIYISSFVSFLAIVFCAVWCSESVDQSVAGTLRDLDLLLPIVTFVFSIVLVVATFIISVYSCFRPGAIFGELPRSWHTQYGMQSLPYLDDSPLTVV